MSQLPAEADVVVIGGGPGGSTAATLLAQQGYSVALVEKQKHPRFMVGESLIPHIWKYCEHTGSAEALRKEGFIQKAGGTVIWDGVIRQMQFRDFGYTLPALHVERDRFDEILLDHARSCGAQVFEETTVIDVDLRYPELSEVHYRHSSGETGSVKARFIVDASGQSATLSRQMGLRRVDEDFQFMSMWGYFKDSRFIAADGLAYPFSKLRTIPPTTFVSSTGGWNWMWHIPLRESTSIGLVLSQEEMRNVKGMAQMEASFLERLRRIPVLDRLIEDATFIEGSFHVIRDYSYVPTELAGPGFFLIGDAAAFVDPIFSIGVPMAMYAAFLAAWAIDRSFKKESSTDRNRSMYASQLRMRLEASRALALPLYGSRQKEEALTSYAFELETSAEQELMYVVSKLTTRSENFIRAAGLAEKDVASDKYRTLESIEFAPA